MKRAFWLMLLISITCCHVIQAEDVIQNSADAFESVEREDLSYLIGMTAEEVTRLFPDLEEVDLPHAHYILLNSDIALTFTMDASVGAPQFPMTGVTVLGGNTANSVLGYKTGMALEDVLHGLSQDGFELSANGGYDSDWSDDECQSWSKDDLTVVIYYDEELIVTMLRLRNDEDWTGWTRGEFDQPSSPFDWASIPDPSDVPAENDPYAEVPDAEQGSSDAGTEMFDAYSKTVGIWKNAFTDYIAGVQVDDTVYNVLTVSEVIYNKAEFGSEANDVVVFFLQDINADDLPELFICDYETGDDEKCRIFEIFSWDSNRGRVIRITPEYLEMFLLSDGEMLVRNGRGSATYELYAYHGGESLVLTDAYGYYYGSGDSDRSYYHNGADYSLSEKMTDDEMYAMIDSHGLMTLTCIPATEWNLQTLSEGKTEEFENSFRFTERILEMES